MKSFRCLPALLLGSCLLASTGFAAGKTVRAFILAGQSNMEGKDGETKEEFIKRDIELLRERGLLTEKRSEPTEDREQ